jgi:hypothetical protein
MFVDTLHKGDDDDDDDDNNNNNNAPNFEEILLSGTTNSVKRTQNSHVQLVVRYLLFIC